MHGCLQALIKLHYETKLDNLKLKIWPKQLLGYLELHIKLLVKVQLFISKYRQTSVKMTKLKLGLKHC